MTTAQACPPMPFLPPPPPLAPVALREVYVSSLPPWATDEWLREQFESAGEVVPGVLAVLWLSIAMRCGQAPKVLMAAYGLSEQLHKLKSMNEATRIMVKYLHL